MTPAQFRVLRACFKVCDRHSRRVKIKEVADALGCWIFNVFAHFQALLKLGLLRREERGIRYAHGIYVLQCSFLIFEG